MSSISREAKCVLLLLSLAVAASPTTTFAFGRAVHENLARLTGTGMQFPETARLVHELALLHSELLSEGSHEPDTGRTFLTQFSHRYDAGQRAGWAYCAAAKTIASDSQAAVRHLGHSFHYLQDLGDPTKEIQGRRHEELRTLAERLLEEIGNAMSARARPIQRYIRQENQMVANMSFSEVRHYLASRRATLGTGLRRQEGSDVDLMLRAIASILAAQNRTLVLFAQATRNPVNCDPGPYKREQRYTDKEQYYVVRISGSGYISNYNGSWYQRGFEDQILTVKPGETFTVAAYRLKQKLVGNPCDQGIAAAYPGPHKRPQFWDGGGPRIAKRTEAKLKWREIRQYRLEEDWQRIHSNGPPITVLKQQAGCP
jgi:hypothetical protein